MRLKCLIVLMLLAFMNPCFAIDSDELPFGYYTPENPGDAAQRDCLRDTLGANVVTMGGSNNVNHLRAFRIDSIMVMPNLAVMSGLGDNYSEACYSVWQAEDDTLEIKFEKVAGQAGVIQDTIDCWSAPYWHPDSLPDTSEVDLDTGYVFLDYLWYRQSNWEDTDTTDHPYTPVLSIWADVDSAENAGDTLGFLRIYQVTDWWYADSLHQSLYDTRYILADSFLADMTTNFVDIKFDDYNTDRGNVTCYQLSTTSICSLKVNYLKISNRYGRQLMAGLFDSYIIDAVTQSWSDPDTVYAWELRDEPRPDQFLPYRHVDSLIRVESDNTLFGVSAYSWAICTGRGESFLEMVEPKLWALDLYSFHGSCSNETKYTGNNSGPGWRGLQSSLDFKLVSQLDSTRVLAESYDTDWWFIPQLFAGRGKDAAPCQDFQWRWPTPSELSCETFIGLCYRPDGLLYFKHSWWWSHDSTGYGYGTCGLYDTLGVRKEDLFLQIKNDINPYIKAIDSTYLGLTWDTAFVVSSPTQTFSGLVKSLRAVPIPESGRDNPVTGPDNGWFQVGEFHDDSNDKYFMLVNRSCSKNSADPTEAPAINAIVGLNPAVLDSHLLIIDIAKGTDAANWVGYPDTTYAAAINGAISYSTTLKAGEGRLYKVAPTNERW